MEIKSKACRKIDLIKTRPNSCNSCKLHELTHQISQNDNNKETVYHLYSQIKYLLVKMPQSFAG